MGLKFVIVSYVKDTGESITRVGFIKKVIFHYDERVIETIYQMFPSAEAQMRGAVPELLSQRVPVDLTVAEDMNLIISSSDRIWQKNFDVPFIMDYSEVDGSGKMVKTLKSFSDLGAIIEEV